MTGTCRLCASNAQLQQSHVIPAFVFNWLKETSGTGYLRFGSAPNKRVQDGVKRLWLCSGCEQTLGRWEREFCESAFLPLLATGGQRCSYEEWMLKFAVSQSWRALMLMRDDSLLDHFNDAQTAAVDQALATWGAFLRGEISNPRQFEQHLIVLDTVADARAAGLPANFNRWIHRTVQVDPVRNPDSAFVLTKFSKFLLFGFIDMPRPREWEGTKLGVRQGSVGTGRYVVPSQLREYLIEQAGAFAEIQLDISEKQWAKIDDTMWGDLDRLARSESLKAMKADVDEFGEQAFRIHRPRKGQTAND